MSENCVRKFGDNSVEIVLNSRWNGEYLEWYNPKRR